MNDWFPVTADEITNEWLSGLLGAPVTGFETTFLEGGVLADAFKLHNITYAVANGELPPSLVVKVPNAIPERKDMAVASGAYAKEANFFAQLARDVPLRSPQTYGVFTDGSDTCQRFIIVMEDLTRHSRVFDQVDDPPGVDDACRVALAAAEMHAAFWQSDVLTLPWIGGGSTRYVFGLDALAKQARSSYAPFRELWQRMYGRDLCANWPDGQTDALYDLIAGPKSQGIIDRIYDVLTSRPKTLLHGDMRADNIFRTVGTGPNDTELTFIDWQVLHAGPPGIEFTQAWFNSLDPDVRAHDREMLRKYHDRLLALNPAAEAYTYDALVEDYALGMCFWTAAIITLGVGTLPTFDQPDSARMKLLWEKGVHRGQAAMRDLDLLSRIQSLAEGLPDDPVAV